MTLGDKTKKGIYLGPPTPEEILAKARETKKMFNAEPFHHSDNPAEDAKYVEAQPYTAEVD